MIIKNDYINEIKRTKTEEKLKWGLKCLWGQGDMVLLSTKL